MDKSNRRRPLAVGAGITGLVVAAVLGHAGISGADEGPTSTTAPPTTAPPTPPTTRPTRCPLIVRQAPGTRPGRPAPRTSPAPPAPPTTVRVGDRWVVVCAAGPARAIFEVPRTSG